jgi:hypothetical protein
MADQRQEGAAARQDRAAKPPPCFAYRWGGLYLRYGLFSANPPRSQAECANPENTRFHPHKTQVIAGYRRLSHAIALGVFLPEAVNHGWGHPKKGICRPLTGQNGRGSQDYASLIQANDYKFTA